MRCEYMDGFIEFPAGKYRGAQSKVVGYDPLTGTSAWESKPVYVLQLGRITDSYLQRATVNSVITGTFWDSNLLDTRTGTPRGASFEDGFVCWKKTTYTAASKWTLRGSDRDGTLGLDTQTAFPCLKSGSATLAFTYGALTDVSTTDQDTAVISLEGKVAGYKLLKEFV